LIDPPAFGLPEALMVISVVFFESLFELDEPPHAAAINPTVIATATIGAQRRTPRRRTTGVSVMS
jgi:hypothetical protein